MDRFKGKFCKKNIVKWKKNVIQSNRTRSVQSTSKSDKIEVVGRRIVDMKKLSDELWCHSCDKALSFRDTVTEAKNGLASVFTIKCRSCDKLYRVNTSSTEASTSTKPTYSINSKIVNGAIESGVGSTHLNKILSAAEIPVMYTTIFKRHEKKVGAAIECLASESCLENLIAEREITIEREGLRQLSDWAESNIVYLTISYDAGWQKKGSGRSYNSLTGHGTAIGFYTGKVVGYATRSKRCVFCECHDRKLNTINNNSDKSSSLENEKHDCRKDFDGSSKAMEADMAREIFLKNPHFTKTNVRLGTLIGDDDSSTIATLRKEAGYAIKKWSDKNHAVSKLSKCLYGIKLSTPMVKYFKYCFSCVLEKNKNNNEATKAGLLNIVPHAFDNHINCGDWCKYKMSPENYKHKILPGGKGLTDPVLQGKLLSIFSSFANVADKLSPCASSRGNESLNKTIASKAPKHLHYGGSSSNDIRVSSAILHKNIGNTTIDLINKKMENSPTTKSSLKYRIKNDTIASRRKITSQTVAFKKRRRQLFSNKTNKCSKAIQKEGICYESGYGLDLGIDFVDNFDPTTKNMNFSSALIVLFDLETTGFGKNKEIIQIAAKFQNIEFEIYIMPSQGISPQASQITGLAIQNDTLYYNSRSVITHSKLDAAHSFLQFLQAMDNPIILMAHNCFRFDCPTLMKFMADQGLLKQFTSIVAGFADTLPLFKEKLKDKRGVKSSYSQSALAGEFLNSDALINAHNALVDVTMLQNLIEHTAINITRGDILKNAKDIGSIITQEKKKEICNNLKKPLQCLKFNEHKEKGGLTENMISKIATAGITFENLCQCYSSSGLSGIRVLLAQDVGGKPRITKNQKIIDNLFKKLTSIIEKNQ